MYVVFVRTIDGKVTEERRFATLEGARAYLREVVNECSPTHRRACFVDEDTVVTSYGGDDACVHFIWETDGTESDEETDETSG